MIGELPTSITINGEEWDIRTDFRDILKIVIAFNDPELEDAEKAYICLCVLIESFDELPESYYDDAFKEAVKFIDRGESSGKPGLRTMDWEQDEHILFAAVNKTAGFETRAAEYIHWWTFMGYFMEISDGVFSHVLGLRTKKNKGKKLEKHEREYWNANKDICVIKPKLTEEQQAKKDRLNALLG